MTMMKNKQQYLTQHYFKLKTKDQDPFTVPNIGGGGEGGIMSHFNTHF